MNENEHHTSPAAPGSTEAGDVHTVVVTPQVDAPQVDAPPFDLGGTPASPAQHPTVPPQTVAMVAHDHRKADLVEWAEYNRTVLGQHSLIATGTTGNILHHELGLPVRRLQSGPLGGDQQIGAMIAQGEIDLLVFFWDPLEPQPHDPDVKALLRLAVAWNVPTACNRSTADFLISSPLFAGTYRRRVPGFEAHAKRTIPSAA